MRKRLIYTVVFGLIAFSALQTMGAESQATDQGERGARRGGRGGRGGRGQMQVVTNWKK